MEMPSRRMAHDVKHVWSFRLDIIAPAVLILKRVGMEPAVGDNGIHIAVNEVGRALATMGELGQLNFQRDISEPIFGVISNFRFEQIIR